MSKVKELYQHIIPSGGFHLDNNQSIIEKGQFYYTLSPEKGEGFFWNYFYEDMFVIQKQDFYFYKDFFLESPEPDFIAVQYYFSVSGEEFHPYRQLSPNSLRGYAGTYGRTYQAIYHKNIPIRSVSINIMPDFYNNYLKEKLGAEYINPEDTFKQMMLGVDFPQLVALLKQIHAYTGSGVSAKLFYEGKVLETLALILNEAHEKQKSNKKIHITMEDKKKLKAVADYIDHHFGFSISLDQLCKIAYMGNTKLRTYFKEYFGCNITDYIIQKRIDRSQHLLINTELSISEISKSVGYARSESFAKQFQKVTGLLPREYRKTI